MSKQEAEIFDVDGTLVDVDPFLHHILGEKKDFNAFHAACVNAEPHSRVVHMARYASEKGRHIIVVTARKEMWRAQTSMWLALNGVPSAALYMRANDDGRPDYEVKKDILAKVNQFWDVKHAVDDNPKVIKLWEENGIPTTKIGDWDGEK